MSDEQRELIIVLERVPPPKGSLPQRTHITDTGAAVSKGGTDTHRVVPGSSDETRQQSSDDTNDVILVAVEECPVDITYPSAERKPESTQKVRQPVRPTYHPNRCDLCSTSFRNQLELKKHQEIHHAQRPFVCKLCHKIFIRKGLMHLHLRLRSEDRPFICDACNRKFVRKDGVKTHIPTPGVRLS